MELNLFQSAGLELKEAKVTIWIFKDLKGKINYAGSENNSKKYLKGIANDIQGMIKKIKAELKCEKIIWLIRMDIHKNKKPFTQAEVEIVRKLDRWGCISDDYEIYGKGHSLEEEFGLKDLKEVEIKKDTEEIKSDWSEISKLRKRCEKENLEFAYMFIDYVCKASVYEKKESVSISSSSHMPVGKLGSSYCSWGWNTEKGKAEDLMEEILDFVRLMPYHPEIASIWTTTLKKENVVISFSKKAVEYLTGIGFDFKKYETELKKIKQTNATKEDIQKAKTFKLMEKQIEILRDECWAIRGYFEKLQYLTLGFRRDKDNYYIKKCKEYNIDTSDLNKLKELYNKKAKTYNLLYKKVHEMRFGEPCKEENAYP